MHKHRPDTLRFKDAVACLPKNNRPVETDPHRYRIDLHECGCGALVFFPHTLGLYPVEVEMIEEKKAAKAARAA